MRDFFSLVPVTHIWSWEEDTWMCFTCFWSRARKGEAAVTGRSDLAVFQTLCPGAAEGVGGRVSLALVESGSGGTEGSVVTPWGCAWAGKSDVVGAVKGVRDCLGKVIITFGSWRLRGNSPDDKLKKVFQAEGQHVWGPWGRKELGTVPHFTPQPRKRLVWQWDHKQGKDHGLS